MSDPLDPRPNPDGAAPPLWRLEHVVLPGRSRPRLDDVTVEIPTGVTAILGPSGAGKSSLLNLLVEFEQPASGRVVRCFDPPAGRLPLYWAPPDDGLWPQLTAAQHLEAVVPEGPRPEGWQNRLLADFGLNKSDALPDQLSQGESARLSVLRALAAEPAVLVLDEPLVHVDPAGTRHYWDAIRDNMRAHAPVSLVFSTHNPDVVLREADAVICLEAGRVSYAGSVERLYLDPPDRNLAWSLGPANWLDDAESWFAGAKPGSPPPRRCCRPEHVVVDLVPSSPLIVQAARNRGSVAELELVHEQTGATRRVFHKPQFPEPRRGDRVLLRLLAIALGCLALAGCSESSAGPQLPVGKVDSWSVPAEGASVPTPRAIHATPDGRLYVLDNAGRVLVYNDEGKLQKQWWMPDYSVGKPEKILLLRDGRLAVADTHYHRVVFFDDEGLVLNTLGTLGRGPGEFMYTVAVAEDDDENLYVGEYGDNDRVQKFDKAGKFILEFGKPGTEPGQFMRPSGMIWHDGRIYVVDAFNNRIQVFSQTGEFQQVLGGAEGELYYPYDIARSPAGDLFVVEYGAGRVTKFDARGRLLGRFGTIGSQAGEFTTPWGMTVDSKSRVFVADTGNRRIVKLEL